MRYDKHLVDAPLKSLHQKSSRRGKLGTLGEMWAAQFLEHLGWQILARNWRASRYGEVDIIAQDEAGILVFIEVKSRAVSRERLTTGFLTAGFENIHARKRHKLLTACQFYIAARKLPSRACRLDAIIVLVFPGYEKLDALPFWRHHCQILHVPNFLC